MLYLAFQYWLFVFLAAIGVIQIMAAKEGLKGLWLFPTPFRAYVYSSLLIAFSFAWFFLTGDRAKPGLEGGEQSVLFSLAALSSFLFTLLLSSKVNAKKFRPKGIKGWGLTALKEMTFLQAIRGFYGGFDRKGPGAISPD